MMQKYLPTTTGLAVLKIKIRSEYFSINYEIISPKKQDSY
jgi:hypothetical protein